MTMASHQWGLRQPWRCSEPAARWRCQLWRWRCSAAPWPRGYSSCPHHSSATPHNHNTKRDKNVILTLWDSQTENKREMGRVKSQAWFSTVAAADCYIYYLSIDTQQQNIHCVTSQQWNKGICMERPQESSAALFSYDWSPGEEEEREWPCQTRRSDTLLGRPAPELQPLVSTLCWLGVSGRRPSNPQLRRPDRWWRLSGWPPSPRTCRRRRRRGEETLSLLSWWRIAEDFSLINKIYNHFY